MKKPSGSFLAWENTLCNALDHPRIQSQNAWEDGYASGVAAERERAIVIAKNMKEELEAKFEQTYMEGVIAGAAAEREACAKLCEEEIKRVKPLSLYSVTAENCVKAIRARGKE
jgi:hypothetical protein